LRQLDNHDIQVMECKTPADCKGVVGIIMDVIVCLKMLMLLFGNLQGYLWWHKHASDRFTNMVKLLLVGCSLIVITEFAYRFSDKELIPLFQ